jgi:hypothetical protein
VSTDTSPQTPSTTHYEVLGVLPTATRDEIVDAYRHLIRKHHPDLVGPVGEAMTMTLNAAYHALSDEFRRARYDRTIEFRAPAAAAAPPAAKPAPTMAASQPEWVAPDPDRTYEPQTGKDPRGIDWKRVLPAGSAVRVVAGGIALAAIVASLTVAGTHEADLFVFLSFVGGTLTLFRPARKVGYVLTGVMAAAGIASTLLGTPLTEAAGAALITASAGWALLERSLASLGTLRRRFKQHRSWEVLNEVSAATGVPIHFVNAVAEGNAVIEDATTGGRRVIRVWDDIAPGSWVVLNQADLVVASAPGAAFSSWQKVQRVKDRRAGRAHPQTA